MATTTYSTGTITVAAGGTAVTGAGSAWLTSGVRAGDMLMAAGLCVPIAAVNSTTSITLARAWPGAALSGAVYDIDYRDDDVRSLAAANSLLQTLTNGALTSLAATASAANKLPFFSGANTFALADLTPAARAILALTGTSGAKIPVVTAAGTAVLRDILGTVGQSGGVPTGAIVERGSDANGEYVRFADGTQICTGSASFVDVVTATGALYQTTAAYTWTYPKAFAVAPALSGSAGQTNRMLSLGVPGTTACGFRVLSPASSATAGIATLTAIGRWY